MSWIILIERAIRSLFLMMSVLAVTGLIETYSQAMQGMAPQKSQPPPQHRPGPGIIDWGRALGPLFMPPRGPMMYPPVFPGESTAEPPQIYDSGPSLPSDSGFGPPVEIPKLPAQQEPTPTVKPSITQSLGLTGGNTPMVLGAPVTAIPPGTDLGKTPDDLLKNSPGNTQMPPGNEIAGMPPPGPDIKWPSPVGPDQDAIDAGRKLLEQQRQAEAEAAARKAAEDARKAEDDARRAREAADAMIQKAQEMKQQAQQAIDDMQKKAQQAIDELQKKAEQAIKDAATDAAIDEIDKLTKAADAANQQKQAQADAASKAQEQKAKQDRWAQENAKAWKEHQAKEQKAQQEAQAQEQIKQQQQAQQAQQQKQATQKFQQQEQQDLDSRDTKLRKALGGGP